MPNRRTFLQKLVAFISAVILRPAWGNETIEPATGSALLSAPIPSPSVAVEPCADYNPETVYQALKKALQEINFPIPEKKSVLLKPNIMAQNRPDQAASTHPAIVAATARLFREKGCSVTIGDSMAYYQGGGTREAMETTGLAEVARIYGCRLLPFEQTTLRKVYGGKVLIPLYLTDAVFSHDLVVNLPKLKVHRLARYSGAVKNTYGCVVGATKQLYHKLFQERPDYQEFWGGPIVDVHQAVKPGLNIMDAVVGLDKDGPSANGKPRPTGLVLASTDGPALDAVMCRIIGFDPGWVPALKECILRGLLDPDHIAVIGSLPQIPYTKLPDHKPKTGYAKKLDDHIFEQFIMEPRLVEGKCNRCGECIQKCAVQAIAFAASGEPRFNYDKCIYCYACSEYCPRQAITLHGGATNHAVRGFRSLFKL